MSEHVCGSVIANHPNPKQIGQNCLIIVLKSVGVLPSLGKGVMCGVVNSVNKVNVSICVCDRRRSGLMGPSPSFLIQHV
jgi:hypothetical protein